MVCGSGAVFSSSAERHQRGVYSINLMPSANVLFLGTLQHLLNHMVRTGSVDVGVLTW